MSAPQATITHRYDDFMRVSCSSRLRTNEARRFRHHEHAIILFFGGRPGGLEPSYIPISCLRCLNSAVEVFGARHALDRQFARTGTPQNFVLSKRAAFLPKVSICGVCTEGDGERELSNQGGQTARYG